MVRRAIACALLLAAATCVRVEPYACVADDECLSGEDGRCEATGYCSNLDDTCESGRRYSALAGPHARKCVDDEVGTSSTTEASTTTGESTGERMDVPERTTATNTGDITEPGEVLWSFLYSDEVPGNDVFSDVAAIDEEAFVVAGHTNFAGTGRDVLLVRYRGPDDIEWTATYDQENGTDRASGMVRGGEGALYLTGEFLGMDGYQAWVGRWDAQGNEEWVEIVGNGMAADLVLGYGSVALTVGRNGNANGFAIAHRTWNEAYWDHTLAAMMELRFSAAAARGTDLFVGGQLDGKGYLARVAQAGIEPIASWPEDDGTILEIQGLLTTEDAIFAVGYITTLDAGYQGWIARFDFAGGDPVWERLRGENLNDEFESIALGHDGQLYVVGIAGGAEDPDLWVGEWTQDGEHVWSESYPELDAGEGKARDVAVMAGGDLLVVGEVEQPDGDFDAIALRVAP